MSFVDYLELKTLDYLFGNVAFTPASILYVGLSTTAINDDGTGATEPSSGGYARVAVPNNSAGWSAASGGQKTNGTAIIFPTASAAWGNVTYFFISDASSGGNYYVAGSISPSQTVNQNDSPRFTSGDLTLSLT